MSRFSPFTQLVWRVVLFRDYQRRSIVDRRELLVPLARTGFTIDDDDDEDVQRLRKQQKEFSPEENPLAVSDDDEGDQTDEEKLISTDDQSQTILNFRQRYENDAQVPKTTTASSMGDSSFDMLSDSSSSVADDETSRLNELYGNIAGEQFDGRQRIKIKGDDLKIKGRGKQRPKLMDAQFFQSNDETDQQIDMPKPSAPTLVNTANNAQTSPTDVPDLDSFDFLNDYEGSK